MPKRVFLLAGTGVVLTLVLILLFRGTTKPRQVLLSDGRLFLIEAVTFGTNHVVGQNDSWLVPLRKILPGAAVQWLTPAKGQSRQTTASPALVVWVHAYDATGKYTDCQGVRASFVDEQGDVYPANGLAHGSFSKGFNREAYTFNVFPRRSARLTLQLEPWRSEKTSTLLIPNPCRYTLAKPWTPEALPATHRVGGLDFTLENLAIQTNGGPQRKWEPLSLHWKPLFNLMADGRPATNWEAPEWEAEDATGNRGQTLGLHEPILKFIATAYPKPEAVTNETSRWNVPVMSLPSTPQGLQWNTNRTLRNVPISIIGLFPPGSYTFSRGQLTNAPGGFSGKGWTGLSKQVFPGRWQHWDTHGATNYTAFLRWNAKNVEQRIAVGLRYRQGQSSRTQWGRLDEGGDVSAFVFGTPLQDAREVELEVVLLEPLRAEFVVRPQQERLSRH